MLASKSEPNTSSALSLSQTLTLAKFCRLIRDRSNHSYFTINLHRVTRLFFLIKTMNNDSVFLHSDKWVELLIYLKEEKRFATNFQYIDVTHWNVIMCLTIVWKYFRSKSNVVCHVVILFNVLCIAAIHC